jgi:hypothetical protein
MDMMVIPNRVKVVAVISALALVSGMLTLALLANPTQAQGQGATVEDFPVDFLIDGTPCPDCGGCGVFGEYIRVEGTLHTVNYFRLQEDGTYHVNSHYSLQNVKGVGLIREDDGTFTPSGTEYVIASSGGAVENFVQSGEFVTGTVDLNVIIQKGPGTRTKGETITKQVGFSRVHYIITSEGEVKVENVQFHLECH